MAERTDFYGSNTPKCPKSPCSFQKTGCSFHSFEPILSKLAKKKSPANPLVYWTFWRRVRDSNPRSLSGHSISSAAPSTTRTTLQGLSQHQNYLRKRGELMGRTRKNIKLRIPEKPRKIKGFRSGSYQMATTISSQPRYDLFDSAPCVHHEVLYYLG